MSAGKVEMPDPGKMHLAGHVLRALLESNVRAGARVPRGCIAVCAGQMGLTLVGDGQRLLLEAGVSPEARAVVSGSLDAFTDVALGRGMVLPVLTGRLRLAGNPLALLAWLPLLRVRGASR